MSKTKEKLEEKEVIEFIPQLLPIDKSHHQQLNTIKTTIVKIFKNRGFIDASNEDKYIKKIISDENDDNEYVLSLDFEQNYNTTINNKRVYIKIVDYKNTSITKNSPIGEFLTKYHGDYKLIVAETMNLKSEKLIASYETPCEVFKTAELMINIVDHILVPKHIVLTKEEGLAVLEAYCAKKKDMPLILTTDPVARYYNMQPGEICKIIRPSVMTCETPFYRIVVKSKIMKAKT